MNTVLGRAARSWWVRLLVTALILLYLARQIDMGAAARAVVQVDLRYLGAVLALVALDRAVMILRWILLLRASRVPITATRAASIFLVSSFVGSFLPAGVGGDMARAYGLSRAASAPGEALASVAVDRLLGVLALAIMGVVGLLVWAPSRGWGWRSAVLVGSLIGACASAFWADRLLNSLLPRSTFSHAIVRRLVSAGDAVARYRDRGTVLAQVMGWSLVVQLLRIGQASLLGLGLGIAVPLAYYLVFMPVGLLMLLLPISVSGFGLPQGVIVWLLRPVGVPDEQSFALSTLIVLTGLAGNLPGLVLWVQKPRQRPE